MTKNGNQAKANPEDHPQLGMRLKLILKKNKVYSSIALEHIKDEHGNANWLSQYPEGVGGTRIPAAMLPQIDPFEDLPQPD